MQKQKRSILINFQMQLSSLEPYTLRQFFFCPTLKNRQEVGRNSENNTININTETVIYSMYILKSGDYFHFEENETVGRGK